MATVDENIATLERAILGEARTETEQVKANAQAKAEEIRRRAQEQADNERKGILDQASQQATRLRSQALSTAQLKARSSELAHREKLLERVFKSVKQKLPELQKRPEYDKIVAGLIREGLTQLGPGQVQIRADKQTQQVLTSAFLDEIAKSTHTNLTVGKPLEQGTGVILETEGGHLTFDNTFETRLSRLQGGLRPEIFKILMGESA